MNRNSKISNTYKQFNEQLFFYVFKMLNDKELSKDIVQEVFISLNDNFDKIRDWERISYWLYTNIRNKVYQHLRKRKSMPEFERDSEIINRTSFANDFENNEIVEIIRMELNNISVEQKEVFVLKEYSGLSYKEITEVLNIDLNAVKSRLYMARQNLITKTKNLIE